MRFLLPVFLFSFEGVFAQGFFGSFPDPLKKYLELTDPQVSEILAKNERLGQFRGAKQQRQFAVQFEIAQETQRATLDPMAIGVRYLEIETIRREIEAESKKMTTEIQALLTPTQKTKLMALEEVMRQQGTACSAVSWGLLSQPSLLFPQISTVPPAIEVVAFAAFSFGQFGCATQASSRWFDTTTFQSNR